MELPTGVLPRTCSLVQSAAFHCTAPPGNPEQSPDRTQQRGGRGPRGPSYPGRRPILRSASQRTAVRGGKKKSIWHTRRPPWAGLPLAAPSLTLTGTVAVHEDDSQNDQEETQPGGVLCPEGRETGMLSEVLCPREQQPPPQLSWLWWHMAGRGQFLSSKLRDQAAGRHPQQQGLASGCVLPSQRSLGTMDCALLPCVSQGT